MTLIFIRGLAWLSLTAASGAQTEQTGRVIFENGTSVPGDMYVDGVYGCRAPAFGRCAAEAGTGAHRVELVFADGDIVRSPPFFLDTSQSFTIPVVERATPDAEGPILSV